MRKGLIALLLLGVIIAGVIITVYGLQKGHDTNPLEYRAMILSKLGGMDCYSYNETIKTETNGSEVVLQITGGSFNGTYFSHGTRGDGLEWWNIVKGNELIQMVLYNGNEKTIRVNLSDDYREAMLIYDPVKLALRAVGTGTDMGGNEKQRAYRFNVQIGKEIMTGNITVRVNDSFEPVSIEVGAKIFADSSPYPWNMNASISETCTLPDWAKELLRNNSG